MQHQGRYLFTALIPLGLAFATGWDRVVRPAAGRWAAAGLIVLAAGLAAWGALSGSGLPKWPVAITLTAAVGLALLDVALGIAERVVGGRLGAGSRGQRSAVGVLRTAALAFPYAFLAIVALYALFGVIVPQLTT